MALTSLAGPVIEEAYAADPAGDRIAVRHRSLRVLHAGEPFLRPLLRHHVGVRASANRRRRETVRLGTRRGAHPPRLHNAVPPRYDAGPTLDGECINDPDHSWAGITQCVERRPQRRLAADVDQFGRCGERPALMGCYEQADIPVHRALADAFTVCDNYHCSVLGPTSPNRLYWISAPRSVGSPRRPEPAHPDDPAPPRLFVAHDAGEPHRAGVSWKVYNNRDAGPISTALLDGMIGCFKSSRRIRTRSSPGAAWRRPIRRIWPPMCAPVGCRVCRGDPATGAMRTPGTAAAFGAAGLIDLLRILTSIGRSGERQPSSSATTRMAASSTTSCRRPRRRYPGRIRGRAASVEGQRAKGIRGPIGLGYRVPGW